MALPPGARIGAYEILALIGAGGMGEVYRARDTKLNRDVALKILPERFAVDSDRLARFRREAQILASLNHPNIAAIYGFEESTGIHALVLELIEGPTLTDRVAEGPILIEEALPIARQIVEAIEAAHEHGIVHRDLKPANIKLRPDGAVKVLDFGLAKLAEPAVTGARISSPHVTALPTLTSPAMMTGVGMILGTAAYMSPEQAKGREADKRSDIWAFGAVLYEMLSGHRAFKGDDIADTLAAVLRHDIDWGDLPVSTPAPVRRLLARCLDRDVRRRLRDIGEARIVLDDPLGSAGGDLGSMLPVVSPKRLWRRVIPVLLSAVVAGLLASAVSVYFRPSQAPLDVTRFALMLGQGQVFTSQAIYRHLVAISPDGTQIAYVANGQLYLRSMSGPEARPIAGADAGAGYISSPVFSPDSQSIAFWSSADRTLKKVAVSGGTAVTIGPADQPSGVSWGTDGIVFGQGNTGIMRVPANGGSPDVLVRVKDGEQAHGPQILPGGETVLFSLVNGTGDDRWDKARIVTQSLRAGDRKTVYDGGSDARYVPTGHLVYALGGIVFAVPMDLGRLEVTGRPVAIVEGVRRASNVSGTAHFGFSSTGTLIYVPGPVSTASVLSDLTLIDRKGGVEPLKLPPDAYRHPRVSPSGAQIALATDDGKEAIVSIFEPGSTTSMRRLTFGGRNRFPIWSGDGQRVAFQSDREGDLGIFWQRADGSDAAERLTKPDPGTAHVPDSWSSTSGRFLFEVTKGSRVSLWTFSLQDKKSTPFADVQSTNPINAAFSPDGRWVVYTVSEGAANRMYVQPFPATGAKYQPSKSSAIVPMWSRDGRELISHPPGGLGAVQTITTQPSLSFSAPSPIPRGGANVGALISQRNYDVMPDGRMVGVVAAAGSVGSATTQIQVVLNWFEELKQRVPTH